RSWNCSAARLFLALWPPAKSVNFGCRKLPESSGFCTRFEAASGLAVSFAWPRVCEPLGVRLFAIACFNVAIVSLLFLNRLPHSRHETPHRHVACRTGEISPAVQRTDTVMKSQRPARALLLEAFEQRCTNHLRRRGQRWQPPLSRHLLKARNVGLLLFAQS